MIYSEILQQLKNYNFIISTDYKVEAVSNNILESDISMQLFDMDLVDVFSKKVMFDGFESIEDNVKDYKLEVLETVKQAFNGKELHDMKFIIRLNNGFLETSYTYYLSASLMIDKFNKNIRKAVMVSIKDYNVISSIEESYQNYFEEFEYQFDLINKMNIIGRFIIDYELDKYRVYGNELLPKLLGLKRNKHNFYKLNSRHEESIMENTIVKSKMFYERMELLLSGRIDLLTDEWKVNDRWLRLEAKIITKTAKGTPKITGGIIYDVTDFQNYKDLESVHLFYELAINSGQIGMFHYEFDKHDSSVFTANKIYADIFGISPDKKGMYKTADFLRAQLPLEEHISEYEDVGIQINKIFKGEVEGTNDDILKIQNLKTGEIKYLLTSSKIGTHFENGEAKNFGGIVLDITDRIIRERNQAEYLYKDELTLLGNNRALAKNMENANDGLGLFFDLDNFKKINDTYGHLMGDKMIKFFGECLNKVAKEYENIVVYRLYGDEFFVFCETRHKSFATIFERKVKEHLAKKMKTIEEDISLVASMGSSLYKKGSDIDDFIKTADYAMYETKISKKKREN